MEVPFSRQDPLCVRAVIVRTGRLVCDVEVSDPRFRQCTPQLAGVVARAFPDVPHHACVNDEGDCFGAVMDHTSLPHLLEHLAISMQIRAVDSPDATFVGTTEWTDGATGRARIQLSFFDDLVALRAFNEAVMFLNDAVLTLGL